MEPDAIRYGRAANLTETGLTTPLQASRTSSFTVHYGRKPAGAAEGRAAIFVQYLSYITLPYHTPPRGSSTYRSSLGRVHSPSKSIRRRRLFEARTLDHPSYGCRYQSSQRKDSLESSYGLCLFNA